MPILVRGANMAAGKFCPKCGYSNPAERGACLMCYARLDQSGGGRQCPQCSGEVADKSRFCAGCGTGLVEGVETLAGPMALAALLLEAAGGSYSGSVSGAMGARESAAYSEASVPESAFVETGPALSDSATVPGSAYAESAAPATAESAVLDPSATVPGSAAFSDSAVLSDYDDSHFELPAEEAYQYDSSLGESGYEARADVSDGAAEVDAGKTAYDIEAPALQESSGRVSSGVVEEEMFVPPPPGMVTPEELEAGAPPPPPPPFEDDDFAPPPPPPPAPPEPAAPAPAPAPAPAAAAAAEPVDFGWELDLPEEKEE